LDAPWQLFLGYSKNISPDFESQPMAVNVFLVGTVLLIVKWESMYAGTLNGNRISSVLHVLGVVSVPLFAREGF
jgi:hypothetical protein